LRAYAVATHHFQYAVVREALELYLAQAIDSLDFREWATLMELQEQYDREDQPIKVARENHRTTVRSTVSASRGSPTRPSEGLPATLSDPDWG
jgi:hypothetical protein